MKNFQISGVLLVLIAYFSVCLVPQALGEESSVEEVEILATLPNTFNPSIHHRRPARKVGNFGFGAYSDIFSNYVWRGLKSSRGAVWQPSFTVEYYGVGFNTWLNFPLTAQPNQGQFNEVDLTLYFHRIFEKITFHTWVYAVLHPNNNPLSLDAGKHSFEWDLHISRPVGPVILFTDIFVRLITAPGSVYWDMGVGYRKGLPLNFAIETSGLFALANGKFTKAHIAPVGTVPYLLEFSLAFPWNPIGGFTVTPKFFVSTMLAGSVRAAAPNPTMVWGGVNLSYEIGRFH